MSELPENIEDYFIYDTIDILHCPFTELFSIQDELIIELTSKEVFYGQFLEAGRNRIDITNVKQLDTGNQLNGIYSFYRNEISRIKHLEIKEMPKQTYKSNKLNLDEDEYVRLKEVIKNYVFINENCMLVATYSDAIESLSNVEQIGVVAPGILKRDSVIPLLVLSTWKDIYIFDTSKLVPPHFLPKIKEIFESDNICKIIHKGGPLLDILCKYFNIVSNNVFDTEVVDLMIQKSLNPDQELVVSKNVFECLETYLNFPPIMNKNFNTKSKKWTIRPIKESKLICASQLVAYLITLKEALNDILFTDLYETMDNFCSYYSDITNDFDYSVKFDVKDLTADMQELICDMSSLSVQ